MTFLPVVERELRVAARKRSTFRIRIIAAVLALVIGSFIMLFSRLNGITTAQLGAALFSTLTWLCLGAALSGGLFYTSDCLSEEKREGTLGLLFLTDLRGHDVVLGKLLATSLRGFYAMLAVFPVLAVTMLMGGVTGAQFWKTSLALVNALLYSLAAGMLVSSLSRDSQKAMGAAFLVLLLMLGGTSLVDFIMGKLRGPFSVPFFDLLNPAYVFSEASAWGRSPYWRALGFNLAGCGLLLILTSLLVPRTWQERSSKPAATHRAYVARYGGDRRRVALRRKLLERDPVLWLGCRERWQSLAIWTLALFMALTVCAGAALTLYLGSPFGVVWMAWSSVRWISSVGLYLWAASQAGRFYIDARRSGLMELLLVGPLPARQIVRGIWRALLRMFGAPLVLLFLANLAGSILSQEVIWNGATVSMSGLQPNLAVAIVSSSAAAITAIVNLVALGWFGMWMGMTSKNNNFATLKTLLFVQIIPSFVIGFASGILSFLLLMPTFISVTSKPSGGSPAVATSMGMWFPLLSVGLSTIMSLAKDAGFIVWARNRLDNSFREQATKGIGYAPVLVPPSVPSPIPAPPVILANP
jgi:hypothetical protein